MNTTQQVPTGKLHGTRPLKVCHVSLTLNTGGLERLLADLARHHRRDVCEPTFLALRQVGRFADVIRSHGCEVVQLNTSGRFADVRAMTTFFRQRKFDVVHAHNTYPHIWGSLAARIAGVPLVVQTRHGQRSGHGWLATLQYRQATRLVDRVIAVSDDAARLSVEADRLPTEKVCRIWNGIDVDQFDYRGPGAEAVAIAVARLSPEKDFPTLLRAFAIAARQHTALGLRIVGDGPERRHLEALADQLGVASRVEFLGERHDVPQLLSRSAFFVSTSLTEGISLTLLEAMAVGLPVIATRVGGNPEIVAEGVTGRLTPASDFEAFAAEWVQLAQDPPSWSEYGLAGRARVLTHFDIRRMAAEYEDLYCQLWNERGVEDRSTESAFRSFGQALFR